MRDKILNFITSFCEKHGRHRTIYDRDGVTPYMERYYLLFKDRPDWFPFNITLHKICKSDLPILHDHPWPYATIILKGGYTEHTEYERFYRGPGHIRFRKAKDYHWLEVNDEPSWSLFFMGKRCREWGFLHAGNWVHHEEYLAWRDNSTPEELEVHRKDEEFRAMVRPIVRESFKSATPEMRAAWVDPGHPFWHKDK